MSFSIYNIKGKKIAGNVGNPALTYKNEGELEYPNARSVQMYEFVKPSPTPYTIIMSTFKPGDENNFNFSLWYNPMHGKVTLT
jgi:hypothetical protein